MAGEKLIIYQIFTRLFGNTNTQLTIDGNRDENGVGKFNDISNLALKQISKLGITHIWFTGIIEHAIKQGYPENDIKDGNPLIIKGKAGSPYAIKDYYDVSPDLAIDVNNRLNEFKDLVNRTHQQGMKVIIDFVPNHLAREYNSDKKPSNIDDFGQNDDTKLSFNPNNNFYYLNGNDLELPDELKKQFPDSTYVESPAKATGNDQFNKHPTINDWYETVKLNYGIDILNGNRKYFDPVPDTWKKMQHILKYWINMGVDAFRCDMAEMVSVEFWNWVIGEIKAEYQEIIFIAEVYNPMEYSNYVHIGKFDYMYDKVGLYDTLRSIIQKEKSASEITKCWQNLNGLDKHMLRFLENHDEHRIASNLFACKAHRALPAMVVSSLLNTGPIMIYFGQEVGEPAKGKSGFSSNDGKTTIFDYWNVPEHQKWMNFGKFDGGLLSEEQKELRKYYSILLNLINNNEAIYKGKFYDIMWYNNDLNFIDYNHIYAFLRYNDKQRLLICSNFNSERHAFKLKIPEHAFSEMDLELKQQYNCSDILLNIKQVPFTTSEIIEQGIDLSLEAYESVVFEITY